MNNYYEIPISPPPPPQYVETIPITDNTRLYTNALNTMIIANAYSGPPNPNWRQEIEDNNTSFVDRKCLFFIFFSGFVMYLIYYICRDAL